MFTGVLEKLQERGMRKEKENGKKKERKIIEHKLGCGHGYGMGWEEGHFRGAGWKEGHFHGVGWKEGHFHSVGWEEGYFHAKSGLHLWASGSLRGAPWPTPNVGPFIPLEFGALFAWLFHTWQGQRWIYLVQNKLCDPSSYVMEMFKLCKVAGSLWGAGLCVFP
jgi:hypothetical protein